MPGRQQRTSLCKVSERGLEKDAVGSSTKAAVEQLDSLILTFEESAGQITSHHWPEIAARTMIADFYFKQVKGGNIPSELAPKDWSRFADNVWCLLKATKRVHPDEMEALATKALNVIQLELDSIPTERIPRSLSMFQFTLGVLTKGKMVGATLQRFYPMITPELVELYPEVDRIKKRFEE